MKCIGISSRNGWSLGLAALALGAVALTPQLRADDANVGAARLSSVEGQVRISQGGQVLADPALVNTPLFAGTQIETGDDGKAEIQFDDGSVARLSPDSSLTLASIGDNGVTQIVMEGGLGYFELQGNGPGGDTRVAFGDAVATAAGFTVMRLKMDNPPGELAVFSGNAHLQRGNTLSLDLRGGESIALNATDPSRYNLAQTIEPDSWDDWNSDRDAALNAAATDQTDAATTYTNNDTPNPQWNDLDANGNWYNVPGQGYVWSPYEASSASWDPYGCGHWMWTPRFGYIWVSCESWGYLPYSLGMWSYYDGFGWGWAPGRDRQWWRGGGGYRGINIGTRPRDYHPVPMPSPRGPISREVPRIISVNRGGGDFGGQGLPVRNRNTPVEIGGHTVQPLRPMPGHQRYEPSNSGFVYRPSQGNRGTGAAGNGNTGNQRWGIQRPGDPGTGTGRPGYGNAGQGNPGQSNPGQSNPGQVRTGQGYTGSPNRGSDMNGARPSGPSGVLNSGGTPSRRESYSPNPSPRYIPIPTPQPVQNNEGQGGNNVNPNPGGSPNNSGGQPATPRPTGGGGFNGGGGMVGGQQVVRPSNDGNSRGGGNSTPPPTFNRPTNNGGGGQSNPRPSGGGSFNGGGAPRSSGGGSPAPASRPSGGGGSPRGGGPRSGNVH